MIKKKNRKSSHNSSVCLYLQRAPLVVLGVDPCSEGELCDEDLSRFGKQDRSLRTDHLHRGDIVTPG